MAAIRIQEAASHRLDNIYRCTHDQWGSEQVDRYITGLFEVFGKIDTHGLASRPIPAEFGVDGYFFKYERHFVSNTKGTSSTGGGSATATSAS